MTKSIERIKNPNTLPKLQDSSSYINLPTNNGNYIYDLTGSNDIDGSIGNDRINGLGGDDSLYGSYGNDIIIGEDGNDWIEGNNGDDYLIGGRDNDILLGDDGNDILYGGSSDDILFGGAGNDKLYGGSGDDTFFSGKGNDIISGGNGRNAYYYEKGDGQDTIDNREWNYQKDEFELSDGTIKTAAIETIDDADIFSINNVNYDQLWISKDSNGKLEISVIGTTDKLNIDGFNNNDIIELGDGHYLTNDGVNQLAQAMSKFNPPAMGQLNLSPSQASALNPTLSSAWKMHPIFESTSD